MPEQVAKVHVVVLVDDVTEAMCKPPTPCVHVKSTCALTHQPEEISLVGKVIDDDINEFVKRLRKEAPKLVETFETILRVNL